MPTPPSTQSRRRLALAGLVAVIAAVISALVASIGETPASGAGVSPGMALQVVRAYDRAETRATLQLSTAGQNAVEAAPEATIDDATFAGLRAQGQRRTPPEPQTDVRIVTYVPLQHRGAQTFAAYVSSRVRGQLGAILMVFQRASGHARWRQSLSPAYPGGGSPPAVAVGSSGYAHRLDPAAQIDRLRLTAATVAADYAGLLELAVRGDQLVGGDPFAAGTFTSQLAATDRQTVSQVEGTGAGSSGTAAPAAFPELALELRGGGALVLFTVTVRQRFTARPGLSLVQGAGRTPWSALVAPGTYRSIATTTLMTVAALVPPKRSTRRVRVVAETGAVVRVAAQPAGGSITT
ncbi:MAG TPA: hypothetical protein VMW47_08105 [Verrucomicrobiae bacterium]|nr:hypothetical protein [Verrucomicrobiae bacterium]